MFLAKEESSVCCRACCPGHQPFLLKLYHATGDVHRGETRCGCCYMGDKVGGVHLTQLSIA